MAVFIVGRIKKVVIIFIKGISMGKIVILCSKSIDDLGLFDDIKIDSDYLFRVAYEKHYSKEGLRNYLLNAIKHIHLNDKINAVVSLPKKYIWHSYYDIRSYIEDIDIILVMNGAINFLDYDFLKLCKKRNNRVKVILYLIDSLHSESPALLKAKKRFSDYSWDDIISFDPVDAAENGYKYLGFSYFSKNYKVKSEKTDTEVFFAGGIKGNRGKKIVSVYEYLSNNGINCDFCVSTFGKEIDRIPAGIECNKEYISYNEILQRTINSNCILEVLQEGQHGSSIRYFEAVCYNKKLLTNNKDIVEYPLYDERFMKVFHSPEDIDIDWVKRRIKPHYNYNNEFSPKNLKNRLSALLDE